MRVVIVPGMGCTPVSQSNWYSWLKGAVDSRPRFEECVLREFPDPYACRESRWVPFLENEVGIDENTILVGHSSGASCVMRMLESRRTQGAPPIKGAILVAAAYTDLGDESERRSEYFNRPWDWNSIKQGAEQIFLFHGSNDHLIPVAEARHIAKNLECSTFQYIEVEGETHFFEPFEQLLDVIDRSY